MSRSFKFTVVVLFFVLLAVPAGAAKSKTDKAFKGFDEWVEEVMAEWHVPGLGVAVVHDGTVVMARGYGYRNFEDRIPADGDTLFAIGSNTKSFTATLLGMLSDDGVLDHETPIIEYMPDFRLHDPVATAQMTAVDLITHRSGLPRHDLAWLQAGRSREELYRLLRHLEPSEPFRSKFQYQNLMFMTAGILVERLTGSSWEDQVQARILAPLGMEHANFSVDAIQQDDNFSYGYGYEDGTIERVPYRNIDAIGPAGSINASAAEMATYVQFHLDYGKAGEERLLSEAVARSMQSPHMAMTGPLAARIKDGDEIGDPTYGLGLMVGSYRRHKHVRHGGGIDGFISAMEWLPDDRIGVVVLSNTSANGTVPTLVVRNVFDRLLGMEPIDWAGRARERQVVAERQAAKTAEQDAANRTPGTTPSHPLPDYTGSYEHPGYGVAEVKLVQDALTVEAVGFIVPVEHYHYDVFTVPEGLDGVLAGMAGLKVQFFYNTLGDIDRVTIPLEANVGDIVFMRIETEPKTD